MRGATRHEAVCRGRPAISIHAPHARSDVTALSTELDHKNFNPRSSCEERRITSCSTENTHRFQSTLLMRGATAWHHRGVNRIRHFNPRSSCEERQLFEKLFSVAEIISIHAPHARSDHYGVATRKELFEFQSTLLMRGATSL